MKPPCKNKSIAANDEAFGLINNYTDWQREGLQDTPQIHQVQLSRIGRQKDITYYISGNYAQEDGIMINSNYKRLNLSFAHQREVVQTGRS